jgi:hypothetical protein
MNDMRQGAASATNAFFAGVRHEQPQMRGVTLCGAQPGEVGQYFAVAVTPDGAPMAWKNYAIGAIYTDYRWRMRVADVGVTTPQYVGQTPGFECAGPEIAAVRQVMVRRLCEADEFRALNAEACGHG